MALVAKTLTLDITPGAIPQVVNVSEYDENREYTVTLVDEGGVYEIPSGTTAKIEGSIGNNSFSENAIVSGNAITFALTESMTAKAGDVWAKIKLVKDSKPIQTCAFILRCDRAGLEAEAVIGASGFEEQIADAAGAWLEEQGFQSPTVSITEITGGNRVTFTDAEHPQGQSIDVLNGADGKNYGIVVDGSVDHVLELKSEEAIGAVKSVNGKTGAVTITAQELGALTDVQDGAITYQKLNNSLKAFVTPEMFGAVGDGVTDDTIAMQTAIDYCCGNNGSLMLIAGKHYLLSETININARMLFNGNGAKITSTATWAFYVHSSSMSVGEFTILENLYLICVNGVKVESIRTILKDSRIQNTGTAILVLFGSYESIIDSCYLVAPVAGDTIGIQCETSDIIFNNITGYGEHTFIINKGTSSIYNNIHGWPIDSDYDGSIFFYEVSNAFAPILFNCHSDTYQYAIRSTASMNHQNANIKNMVCNWSNKAEGWLFYAESNSMSKWAFMAIDVLLNTLPTTFHLCNIAGSFCMSHNTFTLTKDDVIKGSNCYVDNATIRIARDTLYVYLFGSVNTAQRTDLELYIPYCQYFARTLSIPVVINNQVYSGKAIGWGGDDGKLKIQCSNGFTANSGFESYVIRFSSRLESFSDLTNNV